MKILKFGDWDVAPDNAHLLSKRVSDFKLDKASETISRLAIDPKYILGRFFEPEGEDALAINTGSDELRAFVLNRNIRELFEQLPEDQCWEESGIDGDTPYDYLPNIPAIYFCVRETAEQTEREVWYIGKTLALRERWKKHHKFDALKAVGSHRIFFQAMEGVSQRDVAILERLYISMFLPPFNDKEVSYFGSSHDIRASYHRGYIDGRESVVTKAVSYFQEEISRLHKQIIELQEGTK